jgi:hypothetical protein
LTISENQFGSEIRDKLPVIVEIPEFEGFDHPIYEPAAEDLIQDQDDVTNGANDDVNDDAIIPPAPPSKTGLAPAIRRLVPRQTKILDLLIN